MSSGCGDVLSLADLQTAKKHQIFEAEVITGKQGGVAGGSDIDFATNPVTGQTQKTLPAILRDAGFRPAPFTFATGGTLTVNDADMAVLWPVSGGGDGLYYVWRGALPKVIPASSSPATTGGVSSSTWQPMGDVTLRNDLASSDAGKGSNLVAFHSTVASSISRALQNKLEDYYDVSDFTSVQAAIDHLATLTGLEYGPTEYQGPSSPQFSSITRTLRLQGKKIPISQPIVLKGSVSIDGQGGGFVANPDFPIGQPLVTTQVGIYYAGAVNNITIDGSNLAVKGVVIEQAYHSKWDMVRVVCCGHDGITYKGGFEFYLSNFEIVCANTPANPLVVGLRVNGSDSHYVNGALRYHPFGVWCEGGGNNRFGYMHTWGLYLYNKQKVCYVVKNSPNNKFIACMADSPTKADFTKTNTAAVDGYVNGGMGFYVDVGSSYTSIIGSTVFMNETAFFVDAGLTFTNWLNPIRVASTYSRIIDLNVIQSSTVTALKVTFDDTPSYDTTTMLAVFNAIGSDFNSIGKRIQSNDYIRCNGVTVLEKNFGDVTGSVLLDATSGGSFHFSRAGNITLSVGAPAVFGDGKGVVRISILAEKGTGSTLAFDGTVVVPASPPNLNTQTTKLIDLEYHSALAKWLLKGVYDYG